ncbi:hypothetical protein JCM17846_30010 [Iodidimonas nitroreducens]|uniref:Uncharacterized protein n=2 Tax=Iodidimonas nitroreducens TaxID=1236968 RepID=A0A5A7NE31_9PROT|nr:hypothetical protein JCM17846_30010 [Iodidimonas nitroreducens]
MLCCTAPLFSAAAQNRTDTAQNVLSDFLSCDPLIIAAERLGCYDSLLKKYKIRYGLIEATPEAIAEAERDRPRQITSPRAVPQGRVGEEGLDSNITNEGAYESSTIRQGDVIRGRVVEREASADDLALPLTTTITGYNSNSVGDFKIRISEGFVFESAGRKMPAGIEPDGQTVVLSKNFLGQWRMKLPNYEKLFEISPVSN